MPKTIRQRRRKAKTDYHARIRLLTSQKPRLVVRKTNRYVIVQLVESQHAQDRIIATATSRDLLAKGWPQEKKGSLKVLAAAYLTGYLLGKRCKQKSREAILDIGMHRNVRGSRIYAALKGACDAGLYIPHDKESLPSNDKIDSSTKTINITKIKEAL